MDGFEILVIREAARREATALLNAKPGEEGSAIGTKLVQLVEDFPLLRNINMTKSKEAALGQAYEKTIKSKRGFLKLQRVLMIMLANPIISIRRLEYTDAGLEDLPYTEAGALFLREICRSPEEIRRLLEELQCAFAVHDLRPSLQRFLRAWKVHAAEMLVAVMRKRLDECEQWLAGFPRRLVINALRLHLHSTIASALMAIMFARPPLASQSLFQQLLRSAFRLHSIAKDLHRIEPLLPSQAIQQHLLAHRDAVDFSQSDVDEVDTADESLARRDQLVASLPSSLLPEVPLTDTQKWTMLRYVELLQERDNQEALVDIFGDEDFVKQFLKELLLGKNKALTLLLFQRGSGLVKFSEQLFACLDRGMADGKNAELSDDELQQRFVLYAGEMLDNALVVLHNLLQLDKDGLLHGLLGWVFGLYAQYQRMQLPDLGEMTASQTEQEREEVAVAAEAIRADPKFAKTNPLPQPVLDLIRQYRTRLLSEFLQITVPIPVLLSSSSHSHEPIRVGGALVHLDVCWNVPAKSMTDRGFRMRGETSAATVWAKPGGGVDLPPITNMRLSFSGEGEGEPGAWQTIPRSLNKGVWGTFPVHLEILRDPQAKRAVTDLKLVDTKSAINPALVKAWTLVGTFRYDLLATMNVWMLLETVGK